MAYDIKFRERALEYIEGGHTYAELYEAFKIYPATIEDWRRLVAETGSLKPRKAERQAKKIDPEKLRAEIKEKPDAYLRELAGKFNCSAAAVHKALKKLGITLKKRLSRIQKNQMRSGHIF